MIPGLKYNAAAKPGKKITTKRRNQSEIKQEYEKRRKREFQVQWKNDRPWLTYDETNNLMFCEWCKKEAVPSCKFVTGSSHFRLDAVRDHEVSKWHKYFEPKYKVKHDSAGAVDPESLASKCLMQMKKADYDKIALKFRTAHAIAKHNRSFLDYNFICKLDKKKGLDLGDQYLNDKSAATMVSHIATVTRSEVCDKLHDCTFFSLTCDGVTDFTGEELENIYVRICNKGVIEDMYLYIGSPNSTSANDLHSLFTETFKTMGLQQVFENKLIGFCADGASNMQGCKSGLGVLLKETRPHLVIVHCLAHRLELSFKDAIKSAQPKLYERCMTLLLGLYYLYHRSPTQKRALKQSFHALEMKQVLPTRVANKSWRNTVVASYPKSHCSINQRAIRQQLETSSHKNAKAEGFARLMSDGLLIVYILKLKECIDQLMKLSLFLQKRDICLADGFHRLAATKNLLTNLESIDVLSVKEIIESGSYQGMTLNFQGGKPNAKQEMFIKKLVSAMEKRFPCTGLVEATMITSFLNWPEKGSESIPEYGNGEVKMMANNFKSYLRCDDDEEVLQEWSLLKAVVYEKYESEIPTLTWKSVQTTFSGQGLDNIFTLVDVILCLPPTSVNNECTFSTMKLCKGKRRGRMKNSTLNDLLTIQLQSESIERFDPDKAIKHWMKTPSGQSRRWGYKRNKPVQSTSTQRSVELEDHNLLLIENEGNEDDDHDAAYAREDESDSELSSDEEDLEMTEMEIERELENV